MADEAGPEVPEGAAAFPDIPAELGVSPLLLAVLHATVFLAGSDEAVVHPAAAEEVLGAVAGCLARLGGAELAKVRADLDALIAYARREKWPRSRVLFFKNVLADYGVGTGEAS